MREGTTYGGQTAEQRREERRAKLITAGAGLVADGGWSALTVRRVCAASSLTARYFYESFADREALVLALFDDLAARAAGHVLVAVGAAPANALDKARAAIGAFVTLVEDAPENAAILFGPADGLPALMTRRITLTRSFAALVEAQGREFYGLVDAAGMDTAATMLAGGLAQTLLDWTTGTLSTTREALIEDCAVMFVAAGEAAVVRAKGAK